MSLKYAILSLLAHDPLTGYELMKLFDGSVGYFWHATHPQIYKELARLERAGQIAHRSVEQRGRPTKKIYSLSDTGRTDLLAWLQIPASAQRVKDEMMLKTFCCGLLGEAEALDLIRRHRELHEHKLQRYQELERFLESGLSVASRERLGPYLTLLRGIRYERDYIGWCDEARALLQRFDQSMPPQPVTRAQTSAATRKRRS
ncbi:MAG TPA: PadR family transcriptional regulator [Kofleriaceae bacterium]